MYENRRHAVHRDAHQSFQQFTIQWNRRTFVIRQARHISSFQKGSSFFETIEAFDGVNTFVFTLSAQESVRLCVKK